MPEIGGKKMPKISMLLRFACILKLMYQLSEFMFLIYLHTLQCTTITIHLTLVLEVFIDQVVSKFGIELQWQC